MPRLTLLTRAYCGLCDAMHAAVAAIADTHGAALEIVDVDADAALEGAWGDLVPVLFLGAPDAAHELCHYRLDVARVQAALAGERAPGSAVAAGPEIR